MKNRLEHIVSYKRREVDTRKKELPLELLLKKEGIRRPSLEDALKKKPGVIAEFKRRSPSRGVINDHSIIEDVVKGYYEGGAVALSILTDAESFGGSLQDLEAAKQIPLPLLRKDFIIDRYQIAEARANGASIILLIAASLTSKEVSEFSLFAKDLGMEVLLELHDEEELHLISEENKLVGINNRNLKDFSVDIDRSLRMVEKLPEGSVAIAESGINSAKEIQTFLQAGFKGFLIGDLFMRAEDPVSAFKKLVEELK